VRRALVSLPLALALALALLACASQLSAQKAATLPMAAKAGAGGLHVSLSFTDMADKKLLAKLKSGLPQTITASVLVYPERGKQPLAATVHSCRVVYDLWEAKYRVHVQDAKRDALHVDATAQQVVQRCFSLSNLAVPGTAALRGKRVYAAAVVEINPMSRQTVKRIRRWLAKPSGDGLGGDAFFGSFVSIFVGRDLGTAERTRAFRTELLRMP
jgi:hypothetical protein